MYFVDCQNSTDRLKKFTKKIYKQFNNKIMKFKTKPKFIEANQFDGSYKCMEQLKVLFPKIKTLTASYHEERNEVGHWQIETLSGYTIVKATDWVALSENGIFVVNDSTLHQLYEPF